MEVINQVELILKDSHIPQTRRGRGNSERNPDRWLEREEEIQKECSGENLGRRFSSLPLFFALYIETESFQYILYELSIFIFYP